ncbi:MULTISPECIES: LysR family transcriptional regulator [unclassified Ensifer]|uniref:LysR family transcriptional regulator n=1 Tax=unclassified Ensifer TaxID=2633371 RepID=UPI000813BA89|nr:MULTISPECIES: LysR family transcriptional regulator [unclassified Ensifer]OCP19038.1 LysR family transcriptional regulator [Ensifer sp. LC384]OCP28075.1 LysR family transcriptional regulator [Ensifer sp. LC54]
MTDLPLADLDAFTAVARERSFRAAAKKRGVSASSLSEALRRLEAKLDVRLLNRTTRSVTPTEAGMRLLERLQPALGEIAGALDQVNELRDSPAGTLKLNVPSIVAREILPLIVGRFLRANPAISLEVTAEDGFIDVLAAGFDAGIRYEERVERDMIAIPIGPRLQRYVTAASPEYLARRGVPQHPHDLLEHDCIRHRFASGVSLLWEFGEGEGSISIAPPAVVTANAVDLEIAAAVHGLGVIRTFEEFLAPHLKSGALVTILDPWVTTFPGPFLYYASRRHMPAPLRAFVDFLKAEQRSRVR